MTARVGLTGGIGSGKSAVAACFADLGVPVLDADAIGRELCVPETGQFKQIVAHFGIGILGAGRKIDRKKLGAIIFASNKQRKVLESILHPPIRAEMYARADEASGAYCILDIPLLVESEQYCEMDRVLVVSCAPAVRMKRLQENRGMSSADVERVMQSQAGEQERLAVADDVIDNNGALADIEIQVQKLHQMYLKMFGVR